MAIVIAPPFDGYEYRRADPGAWSAVKFYPGTGQIVLQLGAQPPNSTGQIFAGATLIDNVRVGIAGSYTFSASVEVGPLTLLPRGGIVAAEIIMGFFGVPGDREEFRPPTPNGIIGWRPGTFQLVFSADLEANVTYPLRCAVGLMMQYSGTPNPLPYAEIIATYRSVARMRDRYEGPEAESLFAKREEKEGTVHELTGAEIGAIDGITPKK